MLARCRSYIRASCCQPDSEASKLALFTTSSKRISETWKGKRYEFQPQSRPPTITINLLLYSPLIQSQACRADAKPNSSLKVTFTLLSVQQMDWICFLTLSKARILSCSPKL